MIVTHLVLRLYMYAYKLHVLYTRVFFRCHVHYQIRNQKMCLNLCFEVPSLSLHVGITHDQFIQGHQQHSSNLSLQSLDLHSHLISTLRENQQDISPRTPYSLRSLTQRIPFKPPLFTYCIVSILKPPRAPLSIFSNHYHHSRISRPLTPTPYHAFIVYQYHNVCP